VTVRNLDKLFQPKSVALIGASPQPNSVGHTVMRNLLAGGFAGELFFINPHHTEIDGHPCQASVFDLANAPDVAVIATPAPTIPNLIADLARKGTRAAIVLSAGLGPMKQEMLEASKPHLLRILGPNCLGLMLPPCGLNASFGNRMALPGDLAFVSQSGALITAVVDWAAGRGIGFSQVVSLGEMADIDLGDMLDFLAAHRETRAILLYVEAVTHAPKFVSAARRAARVKPVIVVKSGRHAGGAHAALSHTGALAGSDQAYDAVFRRCGVLRVKTLDDLFAATETLARTHTLRGDRLAILTNGGGAGVLAADELQDQQGVLAGFDPATLTALDRVLPRSWSHGNPVDIVGDADCTRYQLSLERLLADEGADAVLVLHCPTATVNPVDAANATIEAAGKQDYRLRKPVLTCWLGGAAVEPSRKLFEKTNLPTFASTSDAITGFMQLVGWRRAQTELMQTPPPWSGDYPVDQEMVRSRIRTILQSGRTVMTALETKAVLNAYGIRTVISQIAKSPEDVRSTAVEALKVSQACVVKIASPDISHKSDMGGVSLDLASPEAAEAAARAMLLRITKMAPAARIDGFTVEPMIKKPHGIETIVGMSIDSTFGPMLLFGAGGTAVEVLRDSAQALPPLDDLLAHRMISETRIARLLAGYRDHPPADIGAIARVLMRVSDMIINHPEIRELDINPLLVDESGALVIDARMKIADEQENPRPALAIRPYPTHLEQELSLNGLGEIRMRAIRPDDETRYTAFFRAVSMKDIRNRFFTAKSIFPHEFLAALTQIDYRREMALVAILPSTDELIGVSRLALEPDRLRGEFGILVRSDKQGKGLGWELMKSLLGYAEAEGVKEVYGFVQVQNTQMLAMARKLGFTSELVENNATIRKVVWHPGDQTRAT
jgi:acetyltransferase